MAMSIWYEIGIEKAGFESSGWTDTTITEWLNENTIGEWNIGATKVWFREEADAMFFELRWTKC